MKGVLIMSSEDEGGPLLRTLLNRLLFVKTYINVRILILIKHSNTINSLLKQNSVGHSESLGQLRLVDIFPSLINAAAIDAQRTQDEQYNNGNNNNHYKTYIHRCCC